MNSARRSLSSLLVAVALLLFATFDLIAPVPVPWWIIHLLLLSGTGWLIYSATRRDSGECPFRELRTDRLLLVYGAALILFMTYSLNATHRWEDGVGLLPVKHVKGLPGAVYPEGTFAALRSMAGIFIMMGCALMWRPRDVRLFFGALGSMATVICTLAVWQRMTPQSVYLRTGIFVSPNQFAAWANLALPLLLVTAARIQYRAYQTGQLSNPSPLVYAGAGLVAASVLYTGSRAGSLITILVLAAFLNQQLRIQVRYPFIVKPSGWAGRWAARLMWGLLSGTIAMIFIKGWSRLGTLGTELAFRGNVLADVLAMWRARLWWGTGPGSFAAAFPYYQSETLQNAAFSHAHCEPLQALAEYGVLGVGLLMSGMIWIAKGRIASSAVSSQVPSFRELEVFGALLATGGIVVHGMVDFPWRQPVIAWAVAVCIGILLASSRDQDLTGRQRRVSS